MEKFLHLLDSLRWQDVADIVLNSYILFRFYVLFRGTYVFRVKALDKARSAASRSPRRRASSASTEAGPEGFPRVSGAPLMA